MGNGEKNNALKIREAFGPKESPVDLCICGPKTRGEHGCLCAEERPYSINGYYEPQETVLEEAGRLVSHDRGNTYSHPFDDFGRVTGMALALWGRGPETQEEHALYMILVKLARLSQTPDHRDSIVDIAGYAKTYDMVLQRRQKG
jgi:hypothetical protein